MGAIFCRSKRQGVVPAGSDFMAQYSGMTGLPEWGERPFARFCSARMSTASKRVRRSHRRQQNGPQALDDRAVQVAIVHEAGGADKEVSRDVGARLRRLVLSFRCVPRVSGSADTTAIATRVRDYSPLARG